MKKWLSVLLMLCLLSTIAFAETQEKTYGVDYLGCFLFGMNKNEMNNMQYEYSGDGYISVTILYDRVASIEEYFDAGDYTGEILSLYLNEAGCAASGSLSQLFKSDGSVNEIEFMDFAEVSAWLINKYGEPHYSKETGTAAPNAPDYVYTEDGFYDVEVKGVPASRQVQVDDYEEWVLPMNDGTWMLVYHGKGFSVNSDKETGDILSISDFNSVSYYPYIPE